MIIKAAKWLNNIEVELASTAKLRECESYVWELSNEVGWKRIFRVPPGVLHDGLSMLSVGRVKLLTFLEMVGKDKDSICPGTQLLRLWTSGLLCQTVCCGTSEVARLSGCAAVPFVPAQIDRSEMLVLTENVCLRKSGDSLICEALEVGANVTIIDAPYMASIPLLVTSRSISELAIYLDIEEGVLLCLASFLIGIRALRRGSLPTDLDSRPMLGWSFADRLVHARSRVGTHIGGYGGTFAIHKLQNVPEPPAIRPSRGTPRVSLPSIRSESKIWDLPFGKVLETRRSIRQYSQDPVQLDELGEFLYRVARVKKYEKGEPYERACRPFPSGGALYELEFYVLNHRCLGLDRSLYRYDGLTHELEHVCRPNHDMEKLLQGAAECARIEIPPDILIILAARFLRMNWKYESMAYATILKNVGVAYQTMYLVATAMGLAPCALGGGNSLAFCRAATTNRWEESSVGEFMLSRPIEQ